MKHLSGPKITVQDICLKTSGIIPEYDQSNAPLKKFFFGYDLTVFIRISAQPQISAHLE